MDLWLFMEVLTSLVDPGYRFGDLLLARLVAASSCSSGSPSAPCCCGVTGATAPRA